MTRTDSAPPTSTLDVDATLRWVVVAFRVLSWLWMLGLVIAALVTDEGVRPAVATIAIVLATVWTGLTALLAASRRLANPVFVAADAVVALLIGGASWLANAERFFHGGMPMSAILVAAFAFGLSGALPLSVVIAAEQFLIQIVEPDGLSGAIGSVVFPIFAIVIGVAFDALRRNEELRVEAERRLVVEQRERARHEERADLANRLHDSLLQTLQVIRTDADDTDQVRYLARRQERELRHTIDEFRSPYRNSFRAALLTAADTIEDTYRVEVDVVIRDDAEMDDRLEAVVEAAREAMTNSAKHSGADRIDLYAEAGSGEVQVFVRDRGKGFHLADGPGGGGLEHSLVSRVAAVGGEVRVSTAPDEGTEVAIRVGAG